jgi:group I intron endonuclease
MFYVYKITNIINNKIYIGKTNDIERRWKEHIKIAKAGKKDSRYSYLHSSINKYGKENFTKIIIETFEYEDLAFKSEMSFIKQLRAMDRRIGMNLTSGGEGSSGYHHSNEAIDKMRKSHLGQKSWNKGIPMSEEMKNKLRSSNLGKKHKDETKEKISKGLLGKPKPDEFGQKLREINTGKKLSDQTKSRIGAANCGENSSTCRLKENDVLNIRDQYNSGASAPSISKRYNVSNSTIYAIIRRLSWKHI